MIEITSENKIPDLGTNKVIGNFKMINSKIRIGGDHNILYLDGVVLNNTTINVRHNNSFVFAKDTRISNFQPLIVNHDANIVIMPGLTSGRIAANIGDGNLIIGKDCMFADDIFVQSHDGHAIYSADTYKILNRGKSILIGDHVWLGRRANIIKGSQIGSGSIVGTAALCSNRRFNCNSVIGGLPAHVIGARAFWTRTGVHVLSKVAREQSNTCKNDNFLYTEDEFTEKFIKLDNYLTQTTDFGEKIAKISSVIK